MKRIVYLAIMVLMTSFFVACGEDNAYDGENGLGGTSSAANANDVLVSMQKNILLANAQNLVHTLEAVESKLTALDSNLTTTDLKALQRDFVVCASLWKKVQAVYVAGELSDAMLYVPDSIDFFNKGKNLNVATDIDNALGLEGNISARLLRRSSKSLTGLEYMLFAEQASLSDLLLLMNKDNRKRVEAIQISIHVLLENAQLIEAFYRNDEKFIAEVKESSNILVNVLVQSAFDLRELRIGEAAGYIVKTMDDPNPRRLEYYKSKKSLEAIEAILEAHNEVMGKQSYTNFGSFASENGAEAVVKKIQSNLDNALAIVHAFTGPIESSVTAIAVDAKVRKLYDEMTDLQKNYFESLINALDLSADIIEADGD